MIVLCYLLLHLLNRETASLKVCVLIDGADDRLE
jgi:hypothetical protein